MPGPGGPGPAAQRAAVAGRLDPRLSTQQVLVAAFPELPPEVHMAFVDPARLVLSLREASVGDSGEVGFGNERTVPLTEIGSVLNDQGEVTVRGLDGRTLVQMHFESPQDETIWAQGLRAAIGGDSSIAAGVQTTEEGLTNGGSEEEEMHMLQARSRQLQNRIGSLEAISERRDRQIQKMVKRLDGAMQMLAAVQEMCGQQRNVVDAQRVAITALQKDLGWSEAEETDGFGKSAEAGSGEGAASTGGTAEEEDVEEEEDEGEDASQESPGPSYVLSGDRQVSEGDITAEAEKMLALLKQADEMQRMLQMLEARGAELGLDDDLEGSANSSPPSRSALTAAELAAPAMPLSPAAATSVPLSLAAQAEADEPEPAPYTNGEEEPDSDEAVRERLRALEAEKEHFEGLLRESQQEHEDLLSRLTSMRSLMSAFGTLDDGEGADGEDAGDDDEDESA